MFRSPLQSMLYLTIHPLGANVVASTLSGSDTICNCLNPGGNFPLWLITYRCQPHSFKTRILGKCFHTLINNVSFASLIDVGSDKFKNITCLVTHLMVPYDEISPSNI